MFNLIVQFDGTSSAWERDAQYSIERERIFEHTENEVRSKFSSPEALKELPCFFSYEGLSGDGRAGNITSISSSGGLIAFRYVLNPQIPPIPIYDKATYALFGCHGGELNRTHWAVKDMDIYEVIAGILARKIILQQPVNGVDLERVWGDRRTDRRRVFLSHKADHRKEVSSMAEALKRFGFKTFVAHDDISPTHEWRDEILLALRSMTHFVGLITDDFHSGSWTDQEIGYAFSRSEVTRIFVRLSDVDPCGLAGFEQAVSSNWEHAAERIREIIET